MMVLKSSTQRCVTINKYKKKLILNFEADASPKCLLLIFNTKIKLKENENFLYVGNTDFLSVYFLCLVGMATILKPNK